MSPGSTLEDLGSGVLAPRGRQDLTGNHVAATGRRDEVKRRSPMNQHLEFGRDGRI